MVVLEEVLARDAVALGKAQQLRLKADQPLVDVVKLLDQERRCGSGSATAI